MNLQQGMKFKIIKEVKMKHTAKEVGSGGLEVLGTPYLAAFIEEAAFLCVEDSLETGLTTVGMRLELDHIKPTIVGGNVKVEAILKKIDGKKLDFEIEAEDDSGLISKCQHRRVIVNIERFMENLKGSK